VPALVALFGRGGMWPGYRREPQVRADPLVRAGAANPGAGYPGRANPRRPG
jgi:hypothetical protein